MQTFLPYPNLFDSPESLDNKRLGKQRVEALQILITLATGRAAWRNHPAVRMWRGYEQALIAYGMVCCDVWTARGFQDTTRDRLLSYPFFGNPALPPWWGREDFHASHRSNLLRKAPEHYSKYGWAEPPDLPYVWPV